MPRFKTKPTTDEILQLFDDTEAFYNSSGIRQQWADADKFYGGDFVRDLMLPDEFVNEAVILPTAREIVDSFTDNVDVFHPQVRVSKKGESEKDLTERNMLRKAGLGLLHRNNIEFPISPYQSSKKHLGMYGLTIIKTVWDADRFVDKPAQADGQDDKAYAEVLDTWRSESRDSLPVLTPCIHPYNVLLDPTTEGKDFVFEVTTTTVFEAKLHYPAWVAPPKDGEQVRSPGSSVTRIEFWTPKYRALFYDRIPVFKRGGVEQHDYGFTPYVAIETGFGHVSYDNDMCKRYVGILNPLFDLLISESRNYSIAEIILKRTAYPSGVLEGDRAKEVGKMLVKFGEWMPLPTGVKATPMSPQLPPGALAQWMGMANDYISSYGAPRASRGLGETGVRSGADRRTIMAQANMRYQYANIAYQHGIAKVLSNCLRIMKNVIPGPVSVWARTPADEFDIEVDPKKLHEPFTFYVEFSGNEEDAYRRHDDLERLVSSGLVNRKWAREQMPNIDPEAMDDQDEMDRLAALPSVVQLEDQFLAGLLSAKLSALQAEAGIEAGMLPPAVAGAPPGAAGPAPEEPGRRMVPPIPNQAPPNSAEDMTNRMAQMRSQVPMSATQGMGGGGNRQ